MNGYGHKGWNSPPFPQHDPFHHAGANNPQEEPRRRTYWRFRWEYVLVPLVLLGFMWFLTGVEGPGFTFEDLARFVGAKDIPAYRDLATLGLILIGITATIATWKKG